MLCTSFDGAPVPRPASIISTEIWHAEYIPFEKNDSFEAKINRFQDNKARWHSRICPIRTMDTMMIDTYILFIRSCLKVCALRSTPWCSLRTPCRPYLFNYFEFNNQRAYTYYSFWCPISCRYRYIHRPLQNPRIHNKKLVLRFSTS